MSLLEPLQALAFILLIVFLGYVVLIVVPFLRRKPLAEGDPSRYQWHAFVPCRDEEAVIGTTIRSIRADFPLMHVWVIDDDSEDATADIVAGAAEADAMVHLVRRRRPMARTGKGDALNAAYRELGGRLPVDAPRDRHIVVVVDADGRLAENALRQAAGPSAFGDPRVGAAQVAVWMSNRDDHEPLPGRSRIAQLWGRFLNRMQDIEFRTTIAAMQSLRGHTRSVGLGGNGQFARLSALDLIADGSGEPWHGALLEDYELGIHTMLAGYRTVYLHDTHVEQEALPSLRRLLTQRTRWCQGGMQCARYLPKIIASPNFSSSGVIEAGYFLLAPYLQLLGTIVWPIVGVATIVQGTMHTGDVMAWLLAASWIVPLVLLTGILPFAIWPIVYGTRDERRSPATILLWAFGYWLYVYQNYVCAIRAGWRMLTGRNGWAKTRRNAEAGRALIAKEA
ncbi:MAG: glycosyltransferase family 2 protein [Microbacteriaceae bacterium]|nr:glycosyltransferase family 2 protein [Microbacteriaceae bacterium]